MALLVINFIQDENSDEEMRWTRFRRSNQEAYKEAMGNHSLPYGRVNNKLKRPPQRTCGGLQKQR
jgi:hypothetical protein